MTSFQEYNPDGLFHKIITIFYNHITNNLGKFAKKHEKYILKQNIKIYIVEYALLVGYVRIIT